MADAKFPRNVFVNCPFDREYRPILQAILFCLVRFWLTPRIATERSDAGEPRVQKIMRLVESSRYSIHDLSRCQAHEAGEHYRLNMPFELGMDFGCRHYGGDPYSRKVILILEEQPYRYRAAISDLAGSDETGLPAWVTSSVSELPAFCYNMRTFIDGITNANLRPDSPKRTSRTTQRRNSCTR